MTELLNATGLQYEILDGSITFKTVVESKTFALRLVKSLGKAIFEQCDKLPLLIVEYKIGSGIVAHTYRYTCNHANALNTPRWGMVSLDIEGNCTVKVFAASFDNEKQGGAR